MWVRGLKQAHQTKHRGKPASHPMWVRGLKPIMSTLTICRLVAPYVGAWIETCSLFVTFGRVESHPMWVRGLKHKQSEQKSTLGSRTLCGCVD